MTKFAQVRDPYFYVVATVVAVAATTMVLLSPTMALAAGCTGQQCRVQVPSGQQFTQSCITVGSTPSFCKCNGGIPPNEVAIIWNNCPDGVYYDQ